jgi:two-component system, chemotaxis family, protein-glutamate methylesterase/glutaminase
MIGMETVEKIKVLIVDDAVIVRKVFSQELLKDPAIEVVGTAADAFIAREKLTELKPDVMLLDIEMPQMDGLTFLEQLMSNDPMPVIIVSSLAKEGGNVALRALELGAAEVIAKPGQAYSVKDMSEQLIEKIKAVAKMKQCKRFLAATADPGIIVSRHSNLPPTVDIITIGAATGGPEAIAAILTRLPAEMPPILIVQHMPAYLLKAFAERLNNICALEVREAKDQDLVSPGKVLLAPGNQHMVLQRKGDQYIVAVKDGPLVLHQRPSIEVLFRSVAMYAGPAAIGVLLTGMGKDGAQGLLDMKNAGAFTIAQDEAGCAVYGMPGEAIAINAVKQVAPLEEIPQLLIDHI